MGEIIVIGLVVTAYAVSVVLVYRDATRRRLEVWPWLLLVVFAPFIGVAAYLVQVGITRFRPNDDLR